MRTALKHMFKKKIVLEQAHDTIKEDVVTRYGPNFAEAARKLDMSTHHLHKLLNKEHNERSPDRLMRSLGYKYVTYVVRADK